MSDLPEKICLVIPCYNEEMRLNFEEFKAFDKNCFFLFVNDGSKDNTLELLEKNRDDNIIVFNLEKNSGKAEAVRQGMLYIKTLPLFDEIKWVGYWDADLATPLFEVFNFILYCNKFNVGASSIWGSRVKRLGSNILRSPKRHYLGRLFATVACQVLNLKCYDSQCGAKLFKKELIDIVFSEKFISKWIFDIEILLKLKNYNVIEYPLFEWKDISGSKVKILDVSYRTLIEIFKIRKKYLSSDRTFNKKISKDI
jgi:dolichyl-phosphate beta-glucosyltransferase